MLSGYEGGLLSNGVGRDLYFCVGDLYVYLVLSLNATLGLYLYGCARLLRYYG